MIERDYLMRQLMQLLEIIQKILRSREKGDKQEAEREVSFFYEILRLDPGLAELPVSRYLDTLIHEKKLTNEQLEMVAFVLKEQGEMAEEEAARLDFFSKSLILLQKVDRETISYSMDRAMKLEELKAYLKEN